MKLNRLHFSIEIKAEKSKVWHALWGDKNYRRWGAEFFEGSYVQADNWSAGSQVQFLGADKSGIYSLIEKHTPNEMIQFKHIGTVVNGEEQAIDEETKKWSGATEIYSITEGTDKHYLAIDIDVQNEHLEFMNEKLPKALEVIKSIAEN